MNILNRAVRDLLVTVHEALNATEHPDYSVCAAQTAIRSLVLYEWTDTGWLEDLLEAADAKRCRRADTWDLELERRTAAGIA
jgi:hypothetical protein